MSDKTTMRVSVGVALLLYLVIVGVASSPDLSTVSWGDGPTWIAVGVSLAALAAAWRAGHIAAQLLRAETHREDRAERLDDERAPGAERAVQADLVAAWNDRGTFVVLNGSKLPIWDVELRARHPETADTAETRLTVVPPNRETRQPFVPAEDPSGAPIPVDDVLDDMDALLMQVEIRFRDAAGRIWSRDSHGTLNLVGRSESVQTPVAPGSAP